jgi:hypothetical protein
MPSTLTWIDHDSSAYARSQRILALFSERETRDELGIGPIRDSFADQLFPGTNTIQTRLRYMLFIPWIYRLLEEDQVPLRRFADEAETCERELITPLVQANDRDGGVFGVSAGKKLLRLPSSVYWAGLGAWGLRLYEGSQGQYHREIDEIYARRKQRTRRKDDARHAEDSEDAVGTSINTWNASLPPPPPEFPEGATFALTRDEAQFIQDRIMVTQPESLLAALVRDPQPVEAAHPWAHPQFATFSLRHQALLTQARNFSMAVHGAAVLYNLMLAEMIHREDPSEDKRTFANGLIEKHRETFTQWQEDITQVGVLAWAENLDELWQCVEGHGHRIHPQTRDFVTTWGRLIAEDPDGLVDNPNARRLVELRERKKKGANSRFANRRARDQWGGYSSMARLMYRWPTAQVFIRDLHQALET